MDTPKDLPSVVEATVKDLVELLRHRIEHLEEVVVALQRRDASASTPPPLDSQLDEVFVKRRVEYLEEVVVALQKHNRRIADFVSVISAHMGEYIAAVDKKLGEHLKVCPPHGETE